MKIDKIISVALDKKTNKRYNDRGKGFPATDGMWMNTRKRGIITKPTVWAILFCTKDRTALFLLPQVSFQKNSRRKSAKRR